MESYLAILQDLLIGYTVPVFTKKAERLSRSHPKFYFFDCGIFRSLRPAGPLDRPEEIHGAALEGIVAQHLGAYLSYRNNDTKLFYWRTYAGAEVDFVVYGSDIFAAFEVKNASRLRTEDFKGLRSFQSHYQEVTLRVMLYRGSESMLVEGVHCIPVEQFLKRLHPQKTIQEII